MDYLEPQAPGPVQPVERLREGHAAFRRHRPAAGHAPTIRGAAGVTDEAPDAQHPRVARREHTAKSAHVLIGDAAFKCVVLDLSAAGARISFASPVSLPEFFQLRIRDGSTYEARRRWSRGPQAGVEFTAAASASGDAGQARRALEALEGLQVAIAADWLKILRAERYFGDEALRQAVQDIEAAHERLREKLRPHTVAPPEGSARGG